MMSTNADSILMKVATPTTAEAVAGCMGVKMAQNNAHKKDYREDKFARAYYCQHARLNQLRSDKKRSERATRGKNKKLLKNLLTNRD